MENPKTQKNQEKPAIRKASLRRASLARTALSALAVLALSSCDNSNNERPKTLETIKGQPRSVSAIYSDSGCLAIVLDVNGKRVLAYDKSVWNPKIENYAETDALINSEIFDGDEEPIELTGRYEKHKADRFQIKSLKVEGYKVDF